MSSQTFRTFVVQGLKSWALPRLIEIPESSWEEAIRKAQSIDFDSVERMALILGVVAVTSLLRIESGTATANSLPVIYLVQFFEAASLLVLIIGPFYLRRARRGLDVFITSQTTNRKPKS